MTMIAALILCALVASVSAEGLAANMEGTIQPPHTFRAPFEESQKIPFFKTSGAAEVQKQFVRLTPATKSSSGQLWNTEPVFSLTWELTMEFRVSGGRYLGGDGMAVWLTSRPEVDGDVFGNQADFNGLGIFFDSYDNDGKRDNPQISAMLSDSTVVYDHETDGAYTRLEGAYCKTNYRNSRLPVTVRITMANNTLTVAYDNKGTGIMVPCFNVEKVKVPKGYYLGVTAHTGDVADNHDVYTFSFKSLDPEDIHEVMAKDNALPVDNDRPELTRIAHAFMRWQKATPTEKAVYKNTHLDNHATLLKSKEEGEQAAEGHEHEHDDSEHMDVNAEGEVQAPPEFLERLATDIEFIKQALAHHDPANPSAGGSGGGPSSEDVQGLKDAIEKSQAATHSVIQKQQSEIVRLRQELLDVKSLLRSMAGTDMGAKIGDLATNIEQLKGHIQNEGSKPSTKIEQQLREHVDDLHESIERSSSFGFWTYFIFFQALFAFGFVWWKKMRDDAKKYL